MSGTKRTILSSALDVADKYIKNNIVSNVLVVGTEKMSSIVDWNDRNTCVLFGDGAGACMVTSSDKPGIISSKIGSNGSYKDLLTVNPDTDFIEMRGNDVFKIAVNTMGKLAKETLISNDLSKSFEQTLKRYQISIKQVVSFNYIKEFID